MTACDFPRCRGTGAIIFYEHNLCDACWSKWSKEEGHVTLRKKLGLEPMRYVYANGAEVDWSPDGTVPANPRRVVGVSIVASKKQLRVMAEHLGLAWESTWSRRDARRAIKAAMKGA
jgi:hypothetical protein